ncbi:MAG: tyrosine-type recombinase/integrase [Pseudomonadota bacterium]
MPVADFQAGVTDSGIEQGGCHWFRHAMATHMLENGAELRYIQAILGHADINTTMVYTHLCIDQLRRVHESTHPAEADDVEQAGEY